MRILKSRKLALIVTIISMMFFLSENSMKISPQIKIIINILLIILMAITNILSRDKNKYELNRSLIIKRIIGVAFVICFLGVFVLKKAGVI